MIVYPAMDLMGGHAVRLRQGQFDDVTTYPAQPAHALRGFADAGAEWAHIVDLDGARAGRPEQHELIISLARTTRLKLQAGGGFRTREDIARRTIRRERSILCRALRRRQADHLCTRGLAHRLRPFAELPVVAFRRAPPTRRCRCRTSTPCCSCWASRARRSRTPTPTTTPLLPPGGRGVVVSFAGPAWEAGPKALGQGGIKGRYLPGRKLLPEGPVDV